jgi:serine/threonine protein kinase
MSHQGPSSRPSNAPPLPSREPEDLDVTIPSNGRPSSRGIRTQSGKYPPELTATQSMPPPTTADVYVGKTVDGRYFLERLIGEGGMGVVYRGRHKVIDKKVAVKILRGDFARDAEMTERFLQEARAASTIGNAHIIDISDFGVLPDGATYFAMEYLEGLSLTETMQHEGQLSVARIIHIAKQIARGLAAAHNSSIVHRDLKPDNIYLITRGTDRDFVKILDFGIAKVGGEASRLTRAGSVFGTPHYMSPEQAAGAPVDARTDVYALGVILYEVASGQVPFDADNFMGILTQHMYKPPVPIRSLAPDRRVPAALDAIILKLLSKRIEARYQSMEELVADLELFEKGEKPIAVREMLARSGSFSVPADYFRSPAHTPMAVPAFGADSSVTSRLPKLVTIGSVLVVVLATLAVSLNHIVESRAENERQAAAASAAAVTPPSVPPPPTATAPVVEEHAVVVITEPADAMVSRDGVDLGRHPTIKIPEGKTVTVHVTHPGYQPQSVVLDGTEEKPEIRLTAIPRERPAKLVPERVPAPVVPASTTTTPPRPSDVLGDPWQQRATPGGKK